MRKSIPKTRFIICLETFNFDTKRFFPVFNAQAKAAKGSIVPIAKATGITTPDVEVTAAGIIIPKNTNAASGQNR